MPHHCCINLPSYTEACQNPTTVHSCGCNQPAPTQTYSTTSSTAANKQIDTTPTPGRGIFIFSGPAHIHAQSPASPRPATTATTTARTPAPRSTAGSPQASEDESTDLQMRSFLRGMVLYEILCLVFVSCIASHSPQFRALHIVTAALEGVLSILAALSSTERFFRVGAAYVVLWPAGPALGLASSLTGPDAPFDYWATTGLAIISFISCFFAGAIVLMALVVLVYLSVGGGDD